MEKKYVIVKVNSEVDIFLKNYGEGFDEWTDEKEEAIIFTDKNEVRDVALSRVSLYVGVCELVETIKVDFVEELKPCTLKDLS